MNSEVLETFNSLLPEEDSLLFKEPDPGPISQDAFSSLDLPDFTNFAVEGLDFGDLEFLDLASVPADKTKKGSSCTGPYFNSLATPSGYCSTNFLTEEANRLSVLLSDCGPEKEKASGDSLERNLLDNLEEFFGVGQTSDHVDTLVDPSAPVPMVDPAPVVATDEGAPHVTQSADTSYRQITIKSVVSVQDPEPPPGAIAKIIIRSNKKDDTTRFIFASINDKEEHSFLVRTSNLKRAITMLKPLNLDNVNVIRKLLQLGPKIPSQVKPSNTKDVTPSEFEIIETVDTNTVKRQDNDKLRIADDEESLKASLLSHGIKVDKIVRIKIASGQKFWCCPNCQKAYGKGHELKLHMLGHYNIKPFPCDEPGCSWSFITKTKLARHKQSHSKQKSFMCNVEGCSKLFSTVYNLNAHLKLHNREFVFGCDKCSDRFQTERELQLHQGQMHKLEMLPSLPCPVDGCQKCFFTKTNLDSHVKTHSVPKDTTCNVCGKMFDKPSRLKTHMAFHTGDKPFSCDHQGCSWKFPTQSKLARHKRTHSSEKRFQCNLCDKAFGRHDHLKQHLHSHKDSVSKENSAQLNLCPVMKCGKKYVTRTAFRAHLKTIHGKTEEELMEGPAAAADDISAGQLDFVALLSCVDDLQLPVDTVQLQHSVQVVESEEVVSMDTELLTAVSAVNTELLAAESDVSAVTHSDNSQDLLFTDSVPPSTINLQDLE